VGLRRNHCADRLLEADDDSFQFAIPGASELMKKGKTEKRVKALGWKDGSVAEFLGLTPRESALIEIKLALSRKPALRATA